ncbi:helix-turn-helix domain-containing protein [Lapidilactobacillus salsurivasis]
MIKWLRHWQPKKIITMYWFFFLVIFLIPILILSGNWLREEVANQKRIVATTQEHALDQITDGLDNTIAHLISTANQIALDDDFFVEPNTPEDFHTIEQAIQRYNLSTTLIDKIFINLYRNPNTLYATDGTYDTDPAIQTYHLLAPQLQPAQITAALHTSTPELVITPISNPNGALESTLCLKVPLVVHDTGPKGTVFFVLNSGRLQDWLATSAVSKNQVLGIAQNQRSILLPHDQLAGISLAELTASPAGRQLLENNHSQNQPVKFKRDKTTIALQTRSSDTGFFKVVSYTRPAAPSHPLLTFLNHYLWLFCLILTLGGLLIHWFSKRQYSIIRQLEASLPKPLSDSLAHSEAAQLQQSFDRYVASHQDLILTSKNQLPFVQNQILQLILNGRVVDPVIIKHFLTIAAIEFKRPHWMLVLIDAPVSWKDNSSLDPLTTPDFSAYFIYQVTQEQVVILLNYTNELPLTKLTATLREKVPLIGPETAIYLSRSLDQLSDLHEAYIEAISTQITAHPRVGETVTYDTANDQTLLGEDLFDFTSELKLDNSLIQGNYRNAQEAFEKLFNLASQSYDPRARFDLGMSNLITRILKADYQKHAEVNDELVSQLLMNESLSQLHGILLKTIQRITTADPTPTPTPTPAEQGEALRQYIIANVCSPTLSLVDVADHFDLSVPYTSRYIKEVTGKTFTDFVTERRMTMIQYALTTTDLPIKAIIEQHGYYDVASFTRKFKKLTGITPGAYRRTHQPHHRPFESDQTTTGDKS